jgi:hypothetical protein
LARALDAAYRLADGREGAREKLDGYLLEAADALGFTDGPVSIVVVEREGRS